MVFDPQRAARVGVKKQKQRKDERNMTRRLRQYDFDDDEEEVVLEEDDGDEVLHKA